MGGKGKYVESLIDQAIFQEAQRVIKQHHEVVSQLWKVNPITKRRQMDHFSGGFIVESVEGVFNVKKRIRKKSYIYL